MKERPAYSALTAERQKLLKQLGKWPPVLRGSLRRHMNRCGNPACRCHDPDSPVLHGPYQYLSHRHQNKTHTILLTENKLPHAREWVANYKRLIRAIYRLAEVNFRILRYHHDRLDPNT
jgi:hypothetical protein